MKELKHPILPSILALLISQTEVTETAVKLTCKQLDRADYAAVNEVLMRIGGKWNGSRKAHLFPFDPRPLFAAVVESGMMPAKNPLAFFPTPDAAGDKLFAMIKEDCLPVSGARVLEPSAGQGALVDAFRRWSESWQIDCCEMNELNRRVLESKGVNLVGENFLEYRPDHKYDLIPMNPPFSVEGDKKAWITHIEHAWSMLADEGQIVAITPKFDFQSDKKTVAFRELVSDYGSVLDVPAKAFVTSGTNIPTCCVHLHKTATPRERTEPLPEEPKASVKIEAEEIGTPEEILKEIRACMREADKAFSSLEKMIKDCRPSKPVAESPLQMEMFA